MYSGVAEPASPASTVAASPGARCRRKKFSTTMARTTGTAWRSRRAMNRRRGLIGSAADPTRGAGREAWTLRLLPNSIEAAVDAERARDDVLEAVVGHVDELHVEEPDDGAVLDHGLLELLVERGALGGVGLDRPRLQQIVHLRVRVARAVHEDRALADLIRQVLPVHAQDGIGQVVVEVRGQVEVVVREDALEPGGHVLVAQGDVDADLAQGLLDVLAETLPLLAVGQDVVGDLEAHAVGAPLEP